MTHPILYPIAFAAISLLTYVLTRPIAATDAAPVAYGRAAPGTADDGRRYLAKHWVADGEECWQSCASVIVVDRDGGGP